MMKQYLPPLFLLLALKMLYMVSDDSTIWGVQRNTNSSEGGPNTTLVILWNAPDSSLEDCDANRYLVIADIVIHRLASTTCSGNNWG